MFRSTLEDFFIKDYNTLINEYNQEISSHKCVKAYYDKMANNYFSYEDKEKILEDKIINEIASKKKYVYKANEISFIIHTYHDSDTDKQIAKTYLKPEFEMPDEEYIQLRKEQKFREISKMLIHIERRYPDLFLPNKKGMK